MDKSKVFCRIMVRFDEECIDKHFAGSKAIRIYHADHDYVTKSLVVKRITQQSPCAVRLF
jgi:hypothetical protein